MTGWIGVDLDGTLAEYDGWHGEHHIGKPIPKMVTRVKKWLEEGKEVRIFTARVAANGAYIPEIGKFNTDDVREGQIKDIQDWCKLYLGEVLPVTNKKDFSMIELWDDRCVQIIPNTGETVDEMWIRDLQGRESTTIGEYLEMVYEEDEK